ncbi:MAG TPA: SGNH/GDSL hydrolase family protein [Myxococcales bacterium]|nr:SGNH/GDSL hydrolase family protein [Myxococcales bacterium]
MPDANPRRPSAIRMLVFMFLPAIVFLGLVETVVRFTGVAETCLPTMHAADSFWACDPLLYFKNNPDLKVMGKSLNAAGFRGREFLPKKPGVFRVIALGDSSTFGLAESDEGFYVREPYPRLLEHMLGQVYGPARVEVLNAGSIGYNSYQGLLLLRTKLRSLKPDLVTVRFGWNDHLMSSSGRDEGAFRDSTNPIVRSLGNALLRTALYPFAIRLRLESQAWLGRDEAQKPPLRSAWTPNMSIPDYQNALRQIAALGHAMGARVWLLTAPQGFSSEGDLERFSALPEDAKARKLLTLNAMDSFSQMRSVHNDYIEATRDAAREAKVPLIDLDALYRKTSDERLFALSDAVHPTLQGHILEAKVLHRRLKKQRVLEDYFANAPVDP